MRLSSQIVGLVLGAATCASAAIAGDPRKVTVTVTARDVGSRRDWHGESLCFAKEDEACAAVAASKGLIVAKKGHGCHVVRLKSEENRLSIEIMDAKGKTVQHRIDAEVEADREVSPKGTMYAACRAAFYEFPEEHEKKTYPTEARLDDEAYYTGVARRPIPAKDVAARAGAGYRYGKLISIAVDGGFGGGPDPVSSYEEVAGRVGVFLSPDFVIEARAGAGQNCEASPCSELVQSASLRGKWFFSNHFYGSLGVMGRRAAYHPQMLGDAGDVPGLPGSTQGESITAESLGAEAGLGAEWRFTNYLTVGLSLNLQAPSRVLSVRNGSGGPTGTKKFDADAKAMALAPSNALLMSCGLLIPAAGEP